MRKRKLVPNKFEDSKIGKMVLAIPKNLMKVSVCLIATSFIFMIYVIYTERNLTEMIYGTEDIKFDYSEHRTVHPFFMKM
jgi:hypothetical protein